MKSFINKNKSIIVYLLFILTSSLIFTILEFLGLPYKVLAILLLVINFSLSFIFAYKNAAKSNINGYKSGFKSGMKFILILFLLNLITLNKFSFKTLVYYVIIMLICIIGGIVGKNKQKNYSS